MFFQRRNDVTLLGLVARLVQRYGLAVVVDTHEVEIREKVIDVEARASRHRDGAVGAVEQFADITGPLISLRRRKGLRHEGVRRSAEAIGRGTCSRVE